MATKDETHSQESGGKPQGAKGADGTRLAANGGVEQPNGTAANGQKGNEESAPPTENPEPEKRAWSAEFNTGGIGTQYNNFYQNHPPPKKDLSNLTVKLPTAQPDDHRFKDPRHAEFIQALRKHRVLILSSYKELAGLAAAYAIVYSSEFGEAEKRALFPTQQHVKLDLLDLSSEELLGKGPKILLVEIEKGCGLLKATLEAPRLLVPQISGRLKDRHSYILFSVREDLIDGRGERANDLQSHNVSHFCYLLSDKYGDQAGALEQRLRIALGLDASASPADLHKYYPVIAEHLALGDFEAYLQGLEERQRQPAESQTEQPRCAAMFPRRSEVHRAAVFIGTYFPGLNYTDFDHLERLLLGDAAITKGIARQVFRPNGRLVTVRDKIVEPYTDRWLREADNIFGKCALRTVAAENGEWLVDFREPQSRDELRSDIEARHAWYLRRQCDVLQKKDALFEPEFSQTMVDDLVQLLVGRAVADPVTFGPSWLEHLAIVAYGLCVNPLDSGDEMTRLVLLISGMLNRQGLHRVIGDLCGRLLSGRQHETLLAMLMALAPRLRPGSGFVPISWMRRLLDEGTDETKDWTMSGLLALARQSGAKIYDFLQVIRSWLPAAGRSVDSFTPANRVALQFPFVCSTDTALYALPSDPDQARQTIAWLLEWILDERGAALMDEDSKEPLKSAADLRIALIALVIEHWAWVLEGPSGEAPPEDRKLFAIVLEELNARLSPRARASLQRAWQQLQDEQLALAAKRTGEDRKNVITRKTKLEDLRSRLSTLPRTPEESLPGGLL